MGNKHKTWYLGFFTLLLFQFEELWCDIDEQLDSNAAEYVKISRGIYTHALNLNDTHIKQRDQRMRISLRATTYKDAKQAAKQHKKHKQLTHSQPLTTTHNHSPSARDD